MEGTLPRVSPGDHSALALLGVFALGGLGCDAPVGPPLPQLVVVLDTDLPVAGQITPLGTLSDDAAIDSLRIDVIEKDTGDVLYFHNVVSPDAKDWPVSFGVKSEGAAGSVVRLRIKAFRGRLATPGVLDDVATLEPPNPVTITRIVDLRLPTEGKVTVALFLSGDCMGHLPSLGKGTTCIDADHLDGSSTDGIVTVSDAKEVKTKVGTWRPAIEAPCASPPADDTRVCIPGGFTLLGDATLKGFADGIELIVDPTPLRPVALSPFHLDRGEITVGDLEAVLQASPSAITEMPLSYDPDPKSSYFYCTWQKGDKALPLNCVSRKTAMEVCAARGGSLPTEAQWEHAARGRGQHRDHPWENGDISCCRASVARKYLQGVAGACMGEGPEPVGSHVCDGGDASRDGVRDLAGSLRERVLGKLVPYDQSCWAAPGVLVNPSCEDDPSTTLYVDRGGAWKRPMNFALAALRWTDLTSSVSDEIGFRCAYKDGAP